MNPTLLHQAGEALFGPQWQSPLARALGINLRTMQRYVAEQNPVPEMMGGELTRLLITQLLNERRYTINVVLRKLR